MRVEWASGDVEDVRPDALRVLSRALLPRSIVARVAAPYAQAGTVVRVAATATLRSLADPSVRLEDVPATLLTRATPPLGRLVVRASPWAVGVLVDVDVNLHVAFPNGALVEVTDASPEDVQPDDDDSDEEADDGEAERWGDDALYYPGLAVTARAEFWRTQHVISGKLPGPANRAGGRGRGRGGRGRGRGAPSREQSATVVAVIPTHGHVEWLEGSGTEQEEPERVPLTALHALSGHEEFLLAGDRVCLADEARTYLADRTLPCTAHLT